MSYLIVCAGLRGRILNTGPRAIVPAGQYLRGYDPEYADGYGLAQWTQDPDKAVRYPSLGAAVRAYQAVPRSRPRMENGTVNRPLTAFSVRFVDTQDLAPGNTMEVTDR